MPTKTDKNKPKDVVEQQPVSLPQYSLLFQLEDVVVNGRKVAFDVLKKLLAEHKVDFNIGTFSRHCLYSMPKQYINELVEVIGNRKITAEKLTEEMEKEWAAELERSAKLSGPFGKILQMGQDKAYSVGFVSALPEELANTLFNKLGLGDTGAKLFTFKDAEKVFPGPDIWLKAAKGLPQKPRNCGVLAGHMTACKSALSADMRCVVVPDEFTSFQDYSGARAVVESLDEISAKELFEVFFPNMK